jgi:hypothetical protein
VFVAKSFIVLKNGEEMVQAVRGEKAECRNHVCYTPGGKGAPREANEYNLISIDVVAADEVVHLSDILYTGYEPAHNAGQGVDEGDKTGEKRGRKGGK